MSPHKLVHLNITTTKLHSQIIQCIDCASAIAQQRMEYGDVQLKYYTLFKLAKGVAFLSLCQNEVVT